MIMASGKREISKWVRRKLTDEAALTFVDRRCLIFGSLTNVQPPGCPATLTDWPHNFQILVLAI